MRRLPTRLLMFMKYIHRLTVYNSSVSGRFYVLVVSPPKETEGALLCQANDLRSQRR